MAIIYSYPSVTPVVADILLITQASDPSKATKSITLSSLKTLFGLNDSLNGVGTPGYIPFFETASRLVDSFISQDDNGLVMIGSQASGTRFTNTSVSSPTLDIQGNAIIGNEATDTLTVNSVSTFNANVTALGNATFGDDESTTVSMESTLDVQGPVSDAVGNLGTVGQVLSSTGGGILSWADTTAGTVKGTGTVNFVSKWSATDTLQDSIIFDDGTSVGIGTNDPQDKLEVQGSIYATPVAYSSNEDAYALRIGANNSTAFDMGIKIKSNSAGVPYMSLRSHNTEDLLILESTNVGIGLSPGQQPEDKLHVRGTIRAVATSTNDYAFIGLNTSGSDALGLRYANGSGEVELKDNLGVRRVRLSCDPDDYTYFNGAKGVGVGRDVGGDAKFEVNTALSGEVGAKIISTAGVVLEVETTTLNTADIQRWKIGNTIKAVVDSEGKFGIGRSDAATELDVLGKIRAVAKDTSGFSISSLNSNFTAASGLFFNTGSASLVLKNSANVENVKINSDGDSFLKGGRLGIGADLVTARSTTKVFVESGDIQIDQGSAAAATGIVLQTPDGSTRYKITVDNAGNIVSTQV